MKKITLIIAVIVVSLSSYAQQAKIKIDIERIVSDIDPSLYGNFVEHLGRCVYGGIYEPESPLADDKGFRQDVLKAVKDLNVPLVRYPGSNFVSNYHWLDGVAPERIPRMDYAWQRLETNNFGTNEFVEWAKAIGTEPYFAVNLGAGTIEERYNLEDALVVAGFLNVFVRNADIVKMANMAQLVNVIAPIFTNEKELFLQTIYYPLHLFANHVKGISLDVSVDCETYSATEFDNGMNRQSSRRSVPYLDVSAAVSSDEITICVVNRHKEKALSTDILCQEGSFNGFIEVYEVNGPDIKSMNDFGITNVETKRKNDLNVKGGKFNYSFAPHSFTLLKGKIKR